MQGTKLILDLARKDISDGKARTARKAAKAAQELENKKSEELHRKVRKELVDKQRKYDRSSALAAT